MSIGECRIGVDVGHFRRRQRSTVREVQSLNVRPNIIGQRNPNNDNRIEGQPKCEQPIQARIINEERIVPVVFGIVEFPTQDFRILRDRVSADRRRSYGILLDTKKGKQFRLPPYDGAANLRNA